MRALEVQGQRICAKPRTGSGPLGWWHGRRRGRVGDEQRARAPGHARAGREVGSSIQIEAERGDDSWRVALRTATSERSRRHRELPNGTYRVAWKKKRTGTRRSEVFAKYAEAAAKKAQVSKSSAEASTSRRTRCSQSATRSMTGSRAASAADQPGHVQQGCLAVVRHTPRPSRRDPAAGSSSTSTSTSTTTGRSSTSSRVEERSLSRRPCGSVTTPSPRSWSAPSASVIWPTTPRSRPRRRGWCRCSVSRSRATSSTSSSPHSTNRTWS